MTWTWWPPQCARHAPVDAASALLSNRSVPEYDAFGREVGANTLSGLGSGAPTRAAPEAEAAPVETPEPAPSPLRPPRRRRRRGAGFVALFVLVIVLAPLAIGGLAIFSAVDGATDAVRRGVATIAAPEVSAAPAVPPKGVSGRSLVRRDHFAAALAKLSGSELRLTHLRLAPARIDAQLLTRGGRLRSVQVLPGGATQRLGPDSGSGFDSTGTIPISRLDPRAPQRLARRGAAKLHVRVATLQYLVPTLFSGKVTWVAYFEHARYVLGDAAGRFQRAY
jgi:hypothetical protein